MIDRVLFDWAPITVASVAIAVALDWLLTHAGARASVRVRHVWQGEGSYEMNPRWEQAVDAGQWVSWRFIGAAALLVGALLAVRYLPVFSELDPAFFALAVGAITLVQTPIFMSHASNLQTFRALADPTAVTGSIVMHRWFLHGESAWLFARFAVLWLALWVPSQQAFFLGGVLGCLVLSRMMFRLRAESKAATPAPVASVAPGAPVGAEAMPDGPGS